MNNIKLENVLKNESVDVLQKIFNSVSEELSVMDKQDKVNLEKVNIKMEDKIKILKQEFKEIDSVKKEKISNELSEYINARDYIYAYYYEKYFKERSKNRNKTYDRNYEIIL